MRRCEPRGDGAAPRLRAAARDRLDGRWTRRRSPWPTRGERAVAPLAAKQRAAPQPFAVASAGLEGSRGPSQRDQGAGTAKQPA